MLYRCRVARMNAAARVPVEEDVLPGNLDVVEDDHRVDLVVPAGQRVVVRTAPVGEGGPADVLDPRRTHVGEEADRVVAEDLVVPVTDGRLDKRLIGVGRRGLELGPAHHDPVVGLTDHVQQHVGVLVLRSDRTVAFRVGVGRDVKRVEQLRAPDMMGDVLGELGIDLVQYVLPVEQRPHLADRLVTHPGDHAAGFVEDGVDR
jgi:hypothetical protein